MEFRIRRHHRREIAVAERARREAQASPTYVDGEHEIPSWLKQQEADGTQPTPTADEAATVPTDDADTPPPETDRPAAVSTRPSGGGAPSFAEQLRSGASRLPLAPRKV